MVYTYSWYHWIMFFYIYCFCGWIFESTYVSLKTRQLVNRGFLRLPMLPLYGTGAIMMLWVSMPFKDHLLPVFLAGVVAATLLEYVTGYTMERLFKIKYWDYSNQRFNLHGYICLTSSIAWGFLTIFLTEVIHRPIADLVLNLTPAAVLSFIAVISALFVSDAVRSIHAALDLGHALEAMTKLRAEVEELQLQLSLLKAETSQKVADLSEMSLEYASKKMTASIEEAVQRVSDMHEEAMQLMTDMHEEATQRISDIHESATQWINERNAREHTLSDQLKSLNEKRLKLSRHMTFYRKGLLRGNPSASSGRFAEALKELRDALESKRS